MGNFGRNGAEGRGYTHVLSSSDHREAGATVDRQDRGYARDRSSAGRGGNTVENDLHREKSGNRSTVGSVVADILSVRRLEGLRGGGLQEGRMPASRGGI